MAEQNFEEIIRGAIANILNISPNSFGMDDDIVERLGADSLDIIEIIMACEEALNIEISDHEASQITTLRLAIEHCKKLYAEQVE